MGTARGCVLPVHCCIDYSRPGFRCLWPLKAAGFAHAGKHCGVTSTAAECPGPWERVRLLPLGMRLLLKHSELDANCKYFKK